MASRFRRLLAYDLHLGIEDVLLVADDLLYLLARAEILDLTAVTIQILLRAVCTLSG